MAQAVKHRTSEGPYSLPPMGRAVAGTGPSCIPASPMAHPSPYTAAQRETLMTAVVPASPDPEPGQRRHDKYDRLVAAAQSLPKLKVAVAHPCDAASLGAVFEAAGLSLIEPILIGPLARIRAAAEVLGKDVSTMRIVDAPHSHAAAEAAVELV